MQINLPYNFTYREYQKPQFVAAKEGIKRFYKVWHRRAGKDLTDFQFEIMKAMERKGTYWHMLPEYNQARKAIWQGMTKDGRRFIDYIPSELVAKKNEQEMKVELINGSIIQIVGSDNIDSLVGSNPVGVIFSEFALTNPRAWGLIEPILLENDGWAVFNTTPRGKNHAYDLWELARNNSKWFTQKLTIEDTGVIPVEYIEELRKMGTDEETIQQEYYCSFEGSLQGAYYAEQIKWLEDNNRITNCPYDASLPVYTFWDIGISDYTTIWFMQKAGYEFRLIDYIQRNGQSLSYYVNELQQRGYLYDKIVLPHDAGHRQFSTGKSIAEQLKDIMPSAKIQVLNRTQNVQADITTTRALLQRCVFDKAKCEQGIQAMRSYTKKWNDKRNMYEDNPLHDWASHGADAFRYLSVYSSDEFKIAKPEIKKNEFSFNALLESARGVDNWRV